MTTKIASTASADWSPEMRASWYAETAASDCLGGTFASSSAAFRSASEMNGTPPPSCVDACDFTLDGIASLFWMLVTKDELSVAIRIAPASAVPIEAPRFVIVFWTPPTSELCSSGTAETVTRAELRGEHADPEPDQDQRHEHDLGTGVDVEQSEQQGRPGEEREKAAAHEEPRRGVREDARDADRGGQQAEREGQDPHARVDRRQSECDRQVERHDEEHAGLDEVLEQEHRQASR